MLALMELNFRRDLYLNLRESLFDNQNRRIGARFTLIQTNAVLVSDQLDSLFEELLLVANLVGYWRKYTTFTLKCFEGEPHICIRAQINENLIFHKAYGNL